MNGYITTEMTASSPASYKLEGFTGSKGISIYRDPFSHIERLPEEFSNRYSLRRSIPIEIESFEDESFVATFEEANISMTGTDPQNAQEELTYAILDFFETFRDDHGYWEDLVILHYYIRDKNYVR